MSKEGYVEQFKTVEDLGLVINRLIQEHREAKKRKLGVMFRVVVPPNEPTLYQEGSQGPYTLVSGVRVGDYTFEASSGYEWIVPDPNAGLSFSRTYSHLKSTWKMLRKHAKGANQAGPANVAWWVLENRDMPDGMEFVRDPKRKDHYFLAVTKRMHISTLITNLKFIGYKMTVIKDLTF